MGKSILRNMLLATSVALVLGAPATVDAQGQQALVIQGATLIDGTGLPPVPNSVIVIQGNTITAVGRAGQVQIPAGAQVVNANGKWVVPGLWDCQQNYSWFYGELQLNQGVTSGCDIGDGEELSLVNKEAVNRGKIRGSRMFVGVGHLGGAQPAQLTGFESALSTREIPKTVDETRAVAQKLLHAGADMIQFHDGNNFTPEMVAAGCDEAHKAGKACTLRAGGKVSPAAGAMAGVDLIPHASGIGQAVQKDGSTITGGDMDRYADMDDAKAKALIDIFVKQGTHPVPDIVHVFPTYPKNWAAMQAPIAEAFTNPNLRAYYPSEFYSEQQLTRTRYDTGAVKDRRQKAYLNMIRFQKMLIDAGGKPLIGGDTNAGKVAGFVVHDEMEIWQEGGIKPMQILQAATKWSADALKVGDKLGSVEPGRLADLVIVNADPLADIANLRKIDTVVFDGKVVDRDFHASFSTTFGGKVDDVRVVEDLAWTQRVKAEFTGGRGGAAAGLPDPIESPPPYIQTILPVSVVQGAPTTTLQLKGGNFVARSRVLFDGVSVPYRAVSPTELAVTLDSNMLARAGRFEILVVSPDPQTAPQWSNGTSNKAHFIVDYKY